MDSCHRQATARAVTRFCCGRCGPQRLAMHDVTIGKHLRGVRCAYLLRLSHTFHGVEVIDASSTPGSLYYFPHAPRSVKKRLACACIIHVPGRSRFNESEWKEGSRDLRQPDNIGASAHASTMCYTVYPIACGMKPTTGPGTSSIGSLQHHPAEEARQRGARIFLVTPSRRNKMQGWTKTASFVLNKSSKSQRPADWAVPGLQSMGSPDHPAVARQSPRGQPARDSRSLVRHNVGGCRLPVNP